jgi:putative ABC transport system permease protein
VSFGGGAQPQLPVRIYRWALALLLPHAFTRRFAAELEADFETTLAAARSRRPRSGAALALVRALADVLRRAPVEHWSERGRRTHEEGTMRMWMHEAAAAGRALARRPGFAAVIVGTLALGIGATVTIFTVVNGVLLRPLPFPESERIITINHHAPGLDLPELANSRGTIRVYAQEARTLESVAMVDDGSRNLAGADRPDRVRVAQISPPFFRVVRTQPAIGRAFTEDDVAPGAEPVAVLTDGAWRTRFGGDPAVLGRTVRVDGVETRVIGVMPPGFSFPAEETALLLAAAIPADEKPIGAFGRGMVARMAEGVELDDVRREVESLQIRFIEADPEMTPAFLERTQWSVTVSRLLDEIVEEVRVALWVVLGTVGFLLLIACANVANLFLVRAEGRQREVALRAALGAGRGRLVLTFLSESVILGLAAGAVGLALAGAGVRALVAFGPPDLPRLDAIRIDATVVLFTLGLSIAAGLAFGALPIARYLGRSFAQVLREGGRAVTDSRGRHRARNVLVAVQLALALVLLVGSGLMVRSAARLRAVDPGIDAEGLTTVQISMGEQVAKSQAAAFYRQLVPSLRDAPELETAAGTTSLPLRATQMQGGSFEIESRPLGEGVMPPISMWVTASDGYFETAGIAVLAGRTMTPDDAVGGGRTVWVNETFARSFLDGDALGERIEIAEDGRWWEIVGVVGDVHEMQLHERVKPTAYLPMADSLPPSTGLGSLSVVVRGSAPEAERIAAVRGVVERLSPDVPVTQAESMERIVARSMASTSFTMTLLAIAAAVALLLGTVGVYGVIAYAVSQRTREIGLRMALGARARDVQGMVVRQGMAVVVLGTVVGLAGAFALTRLLASLLYEVSATDPLTFVTVPLLLGAVAMAASWLPAVRASRVDPTQALSAE